jgi:hypothetical protein
LLSYILCVDEEEIPLMKLLKALAKAFGLKPDAKLDEILEAVKADPQALLKLEMAKMDYELALEKENTQGFKRNWPTQKMPGTEKQKRIKARVGASHLTMSV